MCIFRSLKSIWNETTCIAIEEFHHNENASDLIAAIAAAENTWYRMDSEFDDSS